MKTLTSLLTLLILPILLFAQDNHALPKDRITAYYFHATARCPTCHKIERYVSGAIQEYFSQELNNGLLTFHSINTKEKENQHFTKDYNLYTKSVVLSLIHDGHEVSFVNLDKIWPLLRSKKKFYNYIRKHVQKLLNQLQN